MGKKLTKARQKANGVFKSFSTVLICVLSEFYFWLLGFGRRFLVSIGCVLWKISSKVIDFRDSITVVMPRICLGRPMKTSLQSVISHGVIVNGDKEQNWFITIEAVLNNPLAWQVWSISCYK